MKTSHLEQDLGSPYPTRRHQIQSLIQTPYMDRLDCNLNWNLRLQSKLQLYTWIGLRMFRVHRDGHPPLPAWGFTFILLTHQVCGLFTTQGEIKRWSLTFTIPPRGRISASLCMRSLSSCCDVEDSNWMCFSFFGSLFGSWFIFFSLSVSSLMAPFSNAWTLESMLTLVSAWLSLLSGLSWPELASFSSFPAIFWS